MTAILRSFREAEERFDRRAEYFASHHPGHGLLDHVCWDTIVYPYDRIGEYTGPNAALCHGIWLVLIKL